MSKEDPFSFESIILAQLAEVNAKIDLMTNLMRKQNAECAEIREALEHFLVGAKHMSCLYEPEDPEQVEDARIGRAVEEFRDRFYAETVALPYLVEHKGRGSCIYNWNSHFIRLLDEVIAKAKEGKANA